MTTRLAALIAEYAPQGPAVGLAEYDGAEYLAEAVETIADGRDDVSDEVYGELETAIRYAAALELMRRGVETVSDEQRQALEAVDVSGADTIGEAVGSILEAFEAAQAPEYTITLTADDMNHLINSAYLMNMSHRGTAAANGAVKAAEKLLEAFRANR